VDRTGWNWLMTLVLAVIVIGACAYFFLVRFQKWGLGQNTFGM
jgi:cytochrome c-type biogenesis protein CcmH/NrfG